ncbi:MBL fold metallo-hydrolase [Anaeromyxobacter paludicola]|uniref:MBL fold metallo-hydrolase n=1 Tax=Anaeromyxobacter paludicola TaxID=2918171 RepID=A0ABN6ND63_9BACT|nr:MBL fold metallo-hydrolase [Anaeromyxobacter paludicola]BDG10345.1 MBL fold metallo-hydrolase [Anaeromyxobacter paludicola]
MLKLGRYQLASLLDCTFALDGGAMFGIVPKPLWEKKIPADARNRIRLAARCLLAVDEGSRRRIVVDDGMGERWDAKRVEIYGIERVQGGLLADLRRHGVEPEEVTDVVLTHLHFDHAGGTAVGPAGAAHLAFPNATWHLQRRNWQWAHAPSEKDGGSFREEDFALLAHSGRLHLVEGDAELFPDVELIVSEGHTVGQQLPRFHGDGTHLTFCGDVIPTHAHLRTSWVMGYDLYPLTTIEEKKMILAEALEEDGILFFEHDPAYAACRLAEEKGEPAFREPVAM